MYVLVQLDDHFLFSLDMYFHPMVKDALDVLGGTPVSVSDFRTGTNRMLMVRLSSGRTQAFGLEWRRALEIVISSRRLERTNI